MSRNVQPVHFERVADIAVLTMQLARRAPHIMQTRTRYSHCILQLSAYTPFIE